MDTATPLPTKKSKRTSRARKSTKGGTAVSITLAELAEGFLRHLAQAGKSLGTQFAYRLELKTALEELGAETALSTLTPDAVERYFESERVTRTRGGREKARPTIDKTRRVLRLAFSWAKEQGFLAELPLPEAATHQS